MTSRAIQSTERVTSTLDEAELSRKDTGRSRALQEGLTAVSWSLAKEILRATPLDQELTSET